jgi:predicted site-specific integrase-resolvase
MSGWAKIKAAATYAGIKERTMRDWLKEGLKHSRLPSGTILIKYAWIDEYLESFTAKNSQVDNIVNETIKELQ